jgi:hypothetical protein
VEAGHRHRVRSDARGLLGVGIPTVAAGDRTGWRHDSSTTPTTEPGVAVIDTCRLMTAGDASLLLGHPVTHGTPGSAKAGTYKSNSDSWRRTTRRRMPRSKARSTSLRPPHRPSIRRGCSRSSTLRASPPFGCAGSLDPPPAGRGPQSVPGAPWGCETPKGPLHAVSERWGRAADTSAHHGARVRDEAPAGAGARREQVLGGTSQLNPESLRLPVGKGGAGRLEGNAAAPTYGASRGPETTAPRTRGELGTNGRPTLPSPGARSEKHAAGRCS